MYLITCTDAKSGTRSTAKNGPELPAEEAQSFSHGLPIGRYMEEAKSKYL